MNDNELWQLFGIGINVLLLFWGIWMLWVFVKLTVFFARKINSLIPKARPKPQPQTLLPWQEMVLRGEWGMDDIRQWLAHYPPQPQAQAQTRTQAPLTCEKSFSPVISKPWEKRSSAETRLSGG